MADEPLRSELLRNGLLRNGWERSYRMARRVVVAVVGATVLFVGLAMVVLPGPALIVIPAGLAILGLEFAWARRWLRHVRDRARAAMASTMGGGAPSAGQDDPRGS